MLKRNKTNKILEFEEILKKIAEGELEAAHYDGNSPAWKIFNKIRFVKEKSKYVAFAQCKTCKVLRTHSPENGTSTLKKHKCKNAIDEVVYRSVLPVEASEIRKTLLVKSLELCATDIIPVDIVSGMGFYNFEQEIKEAIVKKYCSFSMTCYAKVGGNSQLIASVIYFDNDLTKLTKK